MNRSLLIFLGAVVLVWAVGANSDGCASGPPAPDNPWPAIVAGSVMVLGGMLGRRKS